MAELSENQLILLDNLIYLNDVANKNNRTVGDIVDSLLHGGGLDKSKTIKDGKEAYPGQMSRGEWETILKAIEKDKDLTSLKLKHGVVGTTYDTKGNPVRGSDGRILETGNRSATFVDPQGNATVVFRGTSGDYEWHDNGTGGYLSDTDMQKAALDYINSLPYNNITVTGHSKGGNKTQYVAILSDKVDRAVSLDGQGFSKEFLEKYKDEIAANRHKITSISAEADYVNVLLNPIAESDKIFYIDTEEQRDFLNNHKPNIVLDENGQLRGPAERGAISTLINDLTIYLNANMKEPDRSYAVDGLLALLESGEEGFPKESAEHTKESIKKVLPYVGNYLIENAADGAKDFMGLVITSFAAQVFPQYYMDDFMKYAAINAQNFSYLHDLAAEIGGILKNIIVDKLTEFLSNIAVKISTTARQISAAISGFVDKIKDGWDRLVTGIKEMGEKVKNTVIGAGEAIMQFKDKVVQSVTSFCNSLVEGTKHAINAVRDAWNSAVDKVSTFIGDTRDKLAKKWDEFKSGVKSAITATKEGVSRFIDASVRKVRETGEFLVNKIKDGVEKGKEIAARIAASFTAFAERVKEGWERLKAGIRSMAETIKNTAVQAGEAISRFAQHITLVVKRFAEKLVAAFKQALQQVKRAWDSLCDKVKTAFNYVKDAVKVKVSEFKDGVKRLGKLTKDGIRQIGKVSADSFKKFAGKVVKGLAKVSHGLLLVNLARLSDLRSKLKALDTDFEAKTTRMVGEAERVSSSVGRAYSESNVQSQVRQVQKACDDVKNRSRRVTAELERKSKSLAHAEEQYGKIESMLKKGISSRNL